VGVNEKAGYGLLEQTLCYDSEEGYDKTRRGVEASSEFQIYLELMLSYKKIYRMVVISVMVVVLVKNQSLWGGTEGTSVYPPLMNSNFKFQI
jgi:hypothetical protein